QERFNVDRMIGLIVQISDSLVKIWSISRRRIINYSIHDVPAKCKEGDWINIEFNVSGVLMGMHKRESLLEMRRESEELQVLDCFVLDPRNEKAFSEVFGVVMPEREFEWPEERETMENCYLLWMSVLSTARFSLERQPMYRVHSKDGVHAEKYKRLKEEYAQIEYLNEKKRSEDVEREEYREKECQEGGEFSNEHFEPFQYEDFDETILIVGYHDKSRRFFSCSRSGEAYINESVWNKMDKSIVVKGAVFRAKLSCPDPQEINYKVVKLYGKVNGWEGVDIQSTEKELIVELDGVVADSRDTCYAVDTVPFGLVTYPYDKFRLPMEIDIGDALRVVLYRFKNDMKEDHPSKWQVVRVVKKLPERRITREFNDNFNSHDWLEGIVTSTYAGSIFISFKHGNAVYKWRADRGPVLSFGDVVDIVVRDTGDESNFEVVDIGSEIRRREDILVEMFQGTKTSVICTAEVVDRRDDFFVLRTPIIGLAMFSFKECPRSMRVGQKWRVTLMRRREKKRGHPSFWTAIRAMDNDPLEELNEPSRLREEKREERRNDWEEERKDKKGMERREWRNEEEGPTDTSGYSSRGSIPSNSIESRDGDWATVIITGSHCDSWYGSCAGADSIRIYHKFNRYAGECVRGAFYRIQYALEPDGHYYATAMDPVRVYPKDIEVDLSGNKRLQFWCYSRVVDDQGGDFTVRNELIGDALLPLNQIPQSERKLRVGDELETLYFRVNHSTNPIPWKVSNARFSRRQKDNRDEGRNMEEERRERR
ncbi:hypothetical protein PFISCL1PPCAC_16264, partial [Pristionchus fissidentatus]